MRLFDKRGMEREQLYLLGEAIFATIILLSLLVYTRDVANGSLFEQNFMARDLALLIDTAYAAPGDVSLTYTTKLDQKKVFILENIPNQTFSIQFEQSRVNVYPNESIFENPRTYYFGRDSNVFFNKADKISGVFVLKKEGNQFIVQQP